MTAPRPSGTICPHWTDSVDGCAKSINDEVEITCSAGRTVTVEEERLEQDSGLNGADDFIGMSDTTRHFSTSTTVTWTITGVLPDNDGGLDQYSEVYQQVGFQVTTDAGVLLPGCISAAIQPPTG